MRRDDTLRRWTSLRERSYDKRTGASAEVFEDDGEIWVWRVHHSRPAHGEASSRKSARAAARRHVRSLDSKPDRQLHLFTK
jgi:hypothetical protein